MPQFSFDQPIERKGTNSVKYDGFGTFQSDYDSVIPLWIADMDFATPPFVAEAIKKRLEHPILGYGTIPNYYYESICNWFQLKYGFKPADNEIKFIPGIVSGIYKLLECLTDKGDQVLITPPVYYPFAQVIINSGRKVVEVPLQLHNERYELDWDKLEWGMQEAKVFLFCHPHNPGGRVWRREELERIAGLAIKYNTIVLSDEIHADLTYKEFVHIPFPSVSEAASKVGISLMAPSKAFNMPGVVGTHLYIMDEILRDRVYSYIDNNGLGIGDCFTYDAIAAAYKQGAEWLDECTEYIQGNVAYVQDYLARHIPKIKMIVPEASFLIFLDCRGLGLSSTEELNEFFIKRAGLFLNDGAMFGTGGDYFMRLNIGCPRQLLTQVMERLKSAVEKLNV